MTPALVPGLFVESKPMVRGLPLGVDPALDRDVGNAPTVCAGVLLRSVTVSL